MVQGDAYYIPVTITDTNGGPLDLTAVALVRIKLGDVEETYPGNVAFDSETGVFNFPVTQEETYLMKKEKFQVRVVYSDGSVRNTDPMLIYVTPAHITTMEGQDDGTDQSDTER